SSDLVPAGSALAVDREAFSHTVTQQILQHPLIEVEEREATEIPEEGIVVIATGPLTSAPMAATIARMTGQDRLYFYDAVAPIVDFASINMDVAFFASRYDKGDADYINCPMNREQYDAFYRALITAKEAELKEFDKEGQKNPKVFEGCMPVEVMAKRGYDTLRYGPLKPVGLVDKRVGKEAFAVVQLRKENREGTMYNLVGFQTHLTFPEQKRVFSMIPGLESANFLRYGVMHRNTYLRSPGFLDATYAVRRAPRVFFAGQMTGVEGYIESAGSGLVAGVNAARAAREMAPLVFPRETMLGAMARYVGEGGVGDFSPMNANFGIVPPLEKKVRGGKAARNEAISERALASLAAIREEIEE
ncbi:MAG: methylenetetrahydrofolate--tRNA-(uracil(54)-C(5))-methyltransferase (FADH(2)-oxidizing) TrmFO, partial [Ruminococcaceae bacterium]|nr:methylenetetrahydrofolate--tRNA-(uracil(54)-C(5))-methyltransferase (FADH(2)-oxidizing) TrmFO [Oscillospiraceae bacterium]